MEMLSTSVFWIALLQIIWIDIILSGDNAVVIALAVRSLPPHQQNRAVILGTMAAIILRVVLAVFAVKLLAVPYLKIIGAVLLMWIGIKLLLPEKETENENIKASDNLATAVKTILIADFVMSLDNVIAVAAASKDSVVLLIIGLAISIPLIIFSSKLILKLMDRFPIIPTLGGALLGYVAGEMVVTDPAVKAWVDTHMHVLHDYRIAAIICAILVVVIGKFIVSRRSHAGKANTLIDLAEDNPSDHAK